MKNIFNSIKKGLVKAWKATSGFFINLFNKIKSSKLTTLVLMQLKDKWNLSLKSNKKAGIFKIITYIVLFAAISAISYFIMFLLVVKLNIFVSPNLPITVMNVVITCLTIFEGLSILIGETNALYFGKDNAVLITYPVKSDYLFISKVIVYLFDAIKKAFSMFVPVLVAYGILNNLPVGFFFWMPFMVILYMFLLVAICSLLTIPTYYVMRILKKYRPLKILFTVIVLGGVVTGTIFVIKLIPSNINLIRTFEKFTMGLNKFLVGFKNTFKGLYALTITLCGESKGYLYKLVTKSSLFVILVFVFGTALFVFLDLVISKPFYNKMISSRNNFENKPATAKSNKRISKFASLVKFETLRIVRDEKNLVNTLIAVVVTPIFMLLANKIYSAFSTRYIGDVMIIFFNLLLILIFTFTYNVSMSYVFSKDGPSWNINKTMPVDPRRALSSRLVYNLITSVFVYLPSIIIVYKMCGDLLTKGQCVAMVFLVFMLSTSHILLSASFDLMNSQDKTKADIGSEYVAKHETVSIAYGLIIAVITAGIGLLMGVTSTLHIFTRLIIFASIMLALEIYLFLKRIRAVYQEN